MNTFILRERALNDDTLHVADTGKVFSGNLVAILESYTFANEWSDKLHRKGFKSIESMHKYLTKNYTEQELESVEG